MSVPGRDPPIPPPPTIPPPPLPSRRRQRRNAISVNASQEILNVINSLREGNGEIHRDDVVIQIDEPQRQIERAEGEE